MHAYFTPRGSYICIGHHHYHIVLLFVTDQVVVVVRAAALESVVVDGVAPGVEDHLRGRVHGDEGGHPRRPAEELGLHGLGLGL